MEWVDGARQVIRRFKRGLPLFLPVAVITQGLKAVQVLAFEIQVAEAAYHSILDEFNLAALRVESSF